MKAWWGHPVVVLLMLALGACAPKTTPAPSAPTAPRYPDFVFPNAAPGTSPEALTQHQNAWRLLQAGDIKAAERGFAQLAKRSPDVYPAETGLGYAALARRDHKTALAHFDRALAANSGYAPALAGKGQAHLSLNDPARALESFDAALAADPSLTAVRSSADVLRLQVMQGGVGEARKAAQEGRFGDARTAYEQAIMASPQSPFLFRELALVELKEGRLPAALEHARKAVELEPADARNHVAVADVAEASGDLPQAVDALTAAAAIDPSDALTRRLESLREKAAHAALPEALRAVDISESITRAQLAALIGVRLADIVKRAGERSAALATDVRSSWAAEWIVSVTRAGLMDILPNHTFQPEATVYRRDLARAVSRILNVIAAGRPQLAARLRNARHKFTDLPAGHLSHPAASMAVEAGVMAAVEDGSFQLMRQVTGREALAAIAKLRELADTRQ